MYLLINTSLLLIEIFALKEYIEYRFSVLTVSLPRGDCKLNLSLTIPLRISNGQLTLELLDSCTWPATWVTALGKYFQTLTSDEVLTVLCGFYSE